MVEEKMIKTHLIVTGTHEEYSINWHKRIIDLKPLLKNDLPVFVIIGGAGLGRVELNTANMKRIEECAKKLTNPRGRESVTSDSARIYIKEENGKETCIGIVTHNHIKNYAPMFDKVGYR